MPRTLQSLTRQRVRSPVNAVTAADLMTKPAVTISLDEPVSHAARLMYDNRVKRLPVTDGDGRLIGIVTRSDVLSVYSRPDADIQREITQDLILGTFLCAPGRFTVTVKDGIAAPSGWLRLSLHRFADARQGPLPEEGTAIEPEAIVQPAGGEHCLCNQA